MKFMDFFKTKQKKVEEPQKKALEVPAAPPKKEDLPTFPSPDEVPEFGGEIKEAAPEIQKKTPVSVENKEDYAMKKVSEELGERGELKLKKPIFVYLD
ncbi:hypothetical protein GOV06_00555, partial [Candidatus Woesearchaeota archaeon]|nr:hypothetical protein [Candidatus Woesearchaeota archaeon]